MITRRRTRLVRVPDLHAFRNVIVAESNWSRTEAGPKARATTDADARATDGGDRAIVVPTRSAARQLRRIITDPAIHLVTRDELYDLLHTRLTSPTPRLTAIARDVLMQRVAHEAAAAGPQLPFRLRPGLVAEMLRFYDQLRRQSQHVRRFEELVVQALGGEQQDEDDTDTGSRRMLRQTHFLARSFRAYEERLRESHACDEHTLRARLLEEPCGNPIRHVVVTVADWIADPDGLYVADFDLLARIPGLETLTLVCTEAMLGSGFHERLHNWWPGLEEIDGRDVPGDLWRIRPVMVTPPIIAGDEHAFAHRDREEELVAVARRLKDEMCTKEDVSLDRSAVIYKAPLPYLYLAAETFPAADIPYQTFDALPLAAEPTAAAVDLVLDFVAAGFTRDAIVALLRSPHFRFTHNGDEPTRTATSALDRGLSEAKYLGELERLIDLAAGWRDELSAPALHIAVTVAGELSPLIDARPASQQIDLLLAFISRHLRPLDEDAFAARERRARAAIVDSLSALAASHRVHHDPLWTIDDVAVAVRRWIEEQTFVPEAHEDGLHLLDDRAAKYADFDDITIVGLVESDWPERPRRNIFFPPSVLKSLGWASEKDRRAAADARFLDLLGSATRSVALSTFKLEDDALVSPSVQLEEVKRARLSTVARASSEEVRAFVDEALSLDPVMLDRLVDTPRSWAEMRAHRTAADAPEFHGSVGERPARSWSVSALESYLACPFKFFAQHVLRLQEEPEDEEVMDPRRQGQFVHEVFERFFATWQSAGGRAITPGNLDRAREMFTEVVDNALQRLRAAEAGLERTRLLGSPAAAGLGEAVLRMEAERPTPVIERFLEHRLEGEFAIVTAGGRRTVALKGKADRIDLLEDGTFRLIDYKLGWPPARARALQLPIYSLCAEQSLTEYRGRRWTLGEAAYLAFKGPRRVVPLISVASDRPRVLAEAQERLVATIDAIGRGEFPAAPEDVYLCETCSFASVCRKDYVVMGAEAPGVSNDV